MKQPAKKTSIGSAHFITPILTLSSLHFVSKRTPHFQTSNISGYLKFIIFVRTHPCCYLDSSVTSEVKRSIIVATLRSPAKMLCNWQKILVTFITYIYYTVNKRVLFKESNREGMSVSVTMCPPPLPLRSGGLL